MPSPPPAAARGILRGERYPAEKDSEDDQSRDDDYEHTRPWRVHPPGGGVVGQFERRRLV